MTAHCVLISISMIISDVEHLLAIYITSLEKYLFKSSINFLIFFFILSCMSYLCILEINTFLLTSFANIFSHLEGRLFGFVYGFLCYTKEKQKTKEKRKHIPI